jgi:hypothetical protein
VAAGEHVARVPEWAPPAVGIADGHEADTRAAIGCFTELHGDTPEIREVFRGWKEAHDTWDGKTDVVRERRSSR